MDPFYISPIGHDELGPPRSVVKICRHLWQAMMAFLLYGHLSHLILEKLAQRRRQIRLTQLPSEITCSAIEVHPP